MENMDSVKRAEEIAEASAGTAEEKYGAVVDSLTYSINRLTAAWEELVQRMDQSPIFIFLTDQMTNIVKILPIIIQYLSTLFAVANAYKIPTLFKNFTGAFSTKGLFGGLLPEGRYLRSLGLEQGKETEEVSVLKEIRDEERKQTSIMKGGSDGTQVEGGSPKAPFGYNQKWRIDDKGNLVTKDGTTIIPRSSPLYNQIIQGKEAIAKQTALSAAAGGVTGLITGAMAYGDWTTQGGQTRKAVGALAGGISGALSAFGPWGMAAGAVLQVGNMLFQQIYKSEEEERQERVEQARKELEKLGEITQSVNSAIASAGKAVADRTAEDYETLMKSAEQLRKTLNDNEKLYTEFANQLGGGAPEVEKALNQLETGAEGAAEAVRALATAQQIRTAEETYAAQEDERYRTYLKMLEATSQEEYKKYAFQLSNLEKELRTEFLKSSLISTGLSTIGEAELGLYSPEAAVQILAKSLGEIEEGLYKGFIYGSDGKTVTDAFRREVFALLQSDDRYKNLFNSNVMTFGQMGRQYAIAQGINFDDPNALKGLSEMAIETLKDYANTGSEKLRDFAHSMGLTEKQAMALSDALSNLTSADVMSGLDGAISKYETIGKIFSELSKTSSISQENLNKIMTSYSWLMVGADGISQENILSNIVDLVTNPSGEIQTLMASQIVKDARNDPGVYKVFATTLQKSDLWKDMAFTEQQRILTETSFEGVKDIILENKNIWDLWTQAVENSYADLDIYNQFLQSIYDSQGKVLDQQISGFQSLKDALGATNDLREKELNLIKARQALEEAKEEKQLVYRAGIGWTYVSNAEAIAEAQENLDRLELETQQDNLQYQIDQLNTQKEILNHLQQVDQWEQMEKIREALSEKTGDGLFSWLASGQEGNFSQTVYQAVQNAIDSQKAAEDEAESIAVEEAKEALTKLSEARKGLDEALEKNNAEEILKASVNYNNALLKAQEKVEGVNRELIDDPTLKNFMDEVLKESVYQAVQQRTGGALVVVGKEGERVDGDDAYLNLYGMESAESTLLKYGYDLSWIGRTSPQYKPKSYWEQVLENIATMTASGHGWGYASGTFDFMPNALVNENGSEAIVTPYGTLTSLPTHTGIVPADLTSNLYDLGEVAPNLIKTLTSLRSDSMGSSCFTSNEDNSMNINNLNAQFSITEDFDIDGFLQSVKNFVAISKHNR